MPLNISRPFVCFEGNLFAPTIPPRAVIPLGAFKLIAAIYLLDAQRERAAFSSVAGLRKVSSASAHFETQAAHRGLTKRW